MKLYCEKCNSEDVELTDINQPPEERMSIAKFNGFPTGEVSIYRIPSWRVRCRNCGNTREVTEGSITIGSDYSSGGDSGTIHITKDSTTTKDGINAMSFVKK